jgi:hypothetical protein
MVAAAALAAGGSVYAANKAANSQKKAMNAAQVQAEKQAAGDKAANERAINAANRKTASFGDFTQQNLAASLGGAGSTMLTGPGGASPPSSLLGTPTLLGG